MTTTSTTAITPPTSMVRGRDEGEATWFFNALTTKVAGLSETGGAYSLTEHLMTAASNPPLHVQVDEDEAFYVVEGVVDLEVDGEVVTATPGTFAFVARGCPHRFEVRTDTARVLVICSGKATDNLEDFFFAMGDPASSRTLPEPTAPDGPRLDELCARSGIELRG